MRGWAWMLMVMGAACNSPEGNSDTQSPPPGADFSLSTGNFVANAAITLTVTGAPANSVVRFAYSLRGLGQGACPPTFGGRCLSITGNATPLALSVLANGGGSAQLTLVLPTGAAAQNVAFQAATGTGLNTRLSNPVARIVGNVGTVIDPNVDLDGDGYKPSQGDCADFNPTIRPGATDNAGDGIDANCDNLDGTDADQDGWFAGRDCDDTDPNVNPDAPEVCDGRDEDCDGSVDASALGPACRLSDVFSVTAAPADVLFVVDNSGSMSEEQGRLNAASSAFIPPLVAAGVDLHLGVITTDMDNPAEAGRLLEISGRRFATEATPGLEAWFDAATNPGVAGSADEKGLGAAYTALTAPLLTGINAGFYRTNADLHVVVVSDENDYSSVSPQSFSSWFSMLKSGSASSWFHVLVGPANGCPTADPGSGYLSVNTAEGGTFGAVCDATYTAFVREVADLIVSRSTADVFVLDQRADPATIQVTAQVPGVGVVILSPQQWQYDPASQQLRITGLLLPSGSTVTVTYDL